MKKGKCIVATLTIITVLITLLASCTVIKHKAVGAYFGDNIYLFDYNAIKNRLNEIEISYDVLKNFAIENNISNIPDALFAFSGIKAEVFITGNEGTLEAVRNILDAFDRRENTPYVNKIVQSSSALLDENALKRVNRLLDADLKNYLDIINKRKPEAYYYDTALFLTGNDVSYNAKYFNFWFSSI